MCDDSNCQSNKLYKEKNSDKNCQDTNKWPVKPSMDMQLPKPAVLYQYRWLCNDKNCQSTRCYKKKSPVRLMWDHNNCQSANNMCYGEEIGIWRNLISFHGQYQKKTDCK